MEHPTVTVVRGKVNSCKAHWPRLIEIAQISRSWLVQFARGDITNPTINTLQAVSDACDSVLTGETTQH